MALQDVWDGCDFIESQGDLRDGQDDEDGDHSHDDLSQGNINIVAVGSPGPFEYFVVEKAEDDDGDKTGGGEGVEDLIDDAELDVGH